MKNSLTPRYDYSRINLAGLILLLLLPNLPAMHAAAADGPPAIATLPARPTVTVGISVTFAAPVSNPPASDFQWKFDGEDIINGTDSTYTIFSAALSSAGTYSVTATSVTGPVTTTVAVLAVRFGELTNQAVTTGHGLTFSAGGVSGNIQWQVSSPGGPPPWTNLTNGGVYSGTTTAHLTISNTTPAMDKLRYRFVATDNGSVTISHPATLTVSPAFLPFPTSITVDGSGNLFVGDASANTIQKINSAGVIFPVAGTSGTSGPTDGTGAAARFNQPNGLTVLNNRAIIVADTGNATIRHVTADDNVTTLAGRSGIRGNTDGASAGATFAYPTGVAHDANGVIYVADAMNHIIRRITTDGVVSTFAGRAGIPGFADADGSGPAAIFNFPTGLAVDRNGNVYVADTNNNVIRKITSTGVVTTLAGLPNFAGFDDGAGRDALFSHPGGLALDASGMLYVADTENSTIRQITPAGVVTTLAGVPTITGLTDGVGLAALFNHPQSLTVDETTGKIYVADTGNAVIRMIEVGGNTITLALVSADGTPPPPTSPPPSPPSSPPPSPAPAPPPPPSSEGGGALSPKFFTLLFLVFLVRQLQRSRTLAARAPCALKRLVPGFAV